MLEGINLGQLLSPQLFNRSLFPKENNFILILTILTFQIKKYPFVKSDCGKKINK